MQRFHDVLIKTLCALLLVAMASWSVGCNTMEGFGRDIEAGGDAIEDAARDAND